MKAVGLCLAMAVLSFQSNAGTVAGTGGATELTQYANNLQLIQQYEQQVQAYLRQGLQLQNEIRNLQQNPFSALGPDIGNLINSTGKIMAGANSIGSNIAQIDKNFATLYKNPTAATLSANFKNWHATSTGTLEGALKAAGMHRDQFANDTESIGGLYAEAKAVGGNVEGLQVLAKINTKQLQQNQALADLISAQNVAVATYMLTETGKAEETRKRDDGLQEAALAILEKKPAPLQPTKNEFKKWNLYPTK